MMARVLIITKTEDVHTAQVEDVLERKGHEVLIWYGAEFSIVVDERQHMSHSVYDSR